MDGRQQKTSGKLRALALGFVEATGIMAIANAVFCGVLSLVSKEKNFWQHMADSWTGKSAWISCAVLGVITFLQYRSWNKLLTQTPKLTLPKGYVERELHPLSQVREEGSKGTSSHADRLNQPVATHLEQAQINKLAATEVSRTAH